jgi:hypothetical protein
MLEEASLRPSKIRRLTVTNNKLQYLLVRAPALSPADQMQTLIHMQIRPGKGREVVRRVGAESILYFLSLS